MTHTTTTLVFHKYSRLIESLEECTPAIGDLEMESLSRVFPPGMQARAALLRDKIRSRGVMTAVSLGWSPGCVARMLRVGELTGCVLPKQEQPESEATKQAKSQSISSIDALNVFHRLRCGNWSVGEYLLGLFDPPYVELALKKNLETRIFHIPRSAADEWQQAEAYRQVHERMPRLSLTAETYGHLRSSFLEVTGECKSLMSAVVKVESVHELHRILRTPNFGPSFSPRQPPFLSAVADGWVPISRRHVFVLWEDSTANRRETGS